MSNESVLAELRSNYQNRDPLKARVVVESVAGSSAELQWEVVNLLATFAPGFSVPLFGALLDLQLRELAIPRQAIAQHVAVKLMEEPALIGSLTRDAQIHAVTALGDTGDMQALKPLRRLLVTEPVSANVRFTVYEALSKLPALGGGYMLAAGLQDEDELVRIAAARAIERNINATLAQGIINLVQEPPPLPHRIVAAVARAGALDTIKALLGDDAFAQHLGSYLQQHQDPEFLARLSPLLFNARRQTLLAQVGAALSTTDDGHLPLIYAVDDSQVVLKMFASTLARLGCRAKTFINPFEAIEWIDKTPPDLLFTDLNMPEIDGIELASTLRSTPHLPDFPIIMVTTQSYGEDIEQAMLVGVDSFIQKPFDAQDLADVINQFTDFDVSA